MRELCIIEGVHYQGLFIAIINVSSPKSFLLSSFYKRRPKKYVNAPHANVNSSLVLVLAKLFILDIIYLHFQSTRFYLVFACIMSFT